MTSLTKRYRLIWNGETRVIRCCGEFAAGTETRTVNPSFESDDREEIEAKIEQENLIDPNTE